jgi:hypothetical protein
MDHFESKFERQVWLMSRTRRIYNTAIYLPLAMAIITAGTEYTKVTWIFNALGLNSVVVTKIEVFSVITSVFFWVLRYLQFGIGIISVPYLNRRMSYGSESDFMRTLSATSYADSNGRDNEINEDSKAKNEETGSDIQRSHIFKTSSVMSEPRRRLLTEVERLAWRNNINLAFGLLSTGTGLWLLYSTVFSLKATETPDLTHFSMSYIPRLTLVIFVEIFAYFFLGLYKKGLADIKYFQNEITNIESKAVALDAALYTNNSDVISRVIEKISDTERNHILEKGQTTVELEVAKSEKASLLHLIKILPNITKVFGDHTKKKSRPEGPAQY